MNCFGNFNSNIEFLQASGTITGSSGVFFKDIHLTNPISLSEPGESGLCDTLSATSTIGAINELCRSVAPQTSVNSLSGQLQIVGVSGIDVSTSGQNILVGANSGIDQFIKEVGFSGLFNGQMATDDSSQSTSSTSLQDALQLDIITSGGLYRFGFQWEGFVDTDASQAKYIIRFNDSGSELNIEPHFPKANQADIFGGFTYKDLNEGTHKIRLLYSSLDGIVIVNLKHVRLEAWRIGDINV